MNNTEKINLILEWMDSYWNGQFINLRNNNSGTGFKFFVKPETFNVSFYEKELTNKFPEMRVSSHGSSVEVHFKDKNDTKEWKVGKFYYNNNNTRKYELLRIQGNYYYFVICEGSSSDIQTTYHDKLLDTWSETVEEASQIDVLNKLRSARSALSRLFNRNEDNEFVKTVEVLEETLKGLFND